MRNELSQVLLTDTEWIHRCVAQVDSADFGVEWAGGRGALTLHLVDLWDRVLCLELDADFCHELREAYKGKSLNVVRADILSYPLPDRAEAYPLVGNLPYHITGPLLMRILEVSPKLSSFKGLVQWEVAERLSASPGDSDYRAISLLFRLWGTVRIPFKIPSSAFTPSPAVDSGWVEFIPEDIPNNPNSLKDLARRCFRFPRKTLINNLAGDTREKSFWNDVFEEKNWDLKRRPHTLTPDEFEEVHDKWIRQPSS